MPACGVPGIRSANAMPARLPGAIAAIIRANCTVSATSCTRRMRAPAAIPIAAVASEGTSNSFAGRSKIRPMKLLRELAKRIG